MQPAARLGSSYAGAALVPHRSLQVPAGPQTPLKAFNICLRRRLRRPAQVPAHAATGGGSIGGGGGGLGGRGGGGDGTGEGGASGRDGGGNFLLRWRGWQDRVAADPSFPYKVFIEQIIGVGAAVVGDMSSRPYWGLYELDFVFSTLVVGSILNFSLMYLLAPTAGAAAGGGGLLQRIFSEQILAGWGAPGGHMFQAGYPLTKRLLNFIYKGAVFAGVGFAAGLVGTAMSNGLLAARKKLDPEFKSQNEAPDVALNAATWAAHMGVSSNLRYQVAQPAMPPGVFKLLTSVLRTANNILGGISFVTLAKITGVQSSAGDDKKSAEVGGV